MSTRTTQEIALELAEQIEHALTRRYATELITVALDAERAEAERLRAELAAERETVAEIKAVMKVQDEKFAAEREQGKCLSDLYRSRTGHYV